MKRLTRGCVLICTCLAVLFLVGCAADVTVPDETPNPTQVPSPEPVPSPTPYVEERFVELEWPSSLRLGDSDIIRLALIPSTSGYTAQIEYTEHTLELDQVEIPHVSGYEPVAIARLDVVGMDVEPKGDLPLRVLEGQSLVWRWTIYPQSAGRHRLGLNLRLRWEPAAEGEPKESLLWQTGLEILVEAPLGLTLPQARALGITGLLLGGVLALPLAQYATRQRLESAKANRVQRRRPNRKLIIEVEPDISVSPSEETQLRAVFDRYSRILIETRFASGYSGARTFLIQPIRPNGRADAYVIVKIGSRKMIKSEYANYQSFVRHTLPPITGRVLGPPVVVSGERDAALQYTFVGTPGAVPVSLRSFTLARSPDETSILIEEQLFDTFGPAWWMQRQPYNFRISQEYNRLLPVQLLLETTDSTDHDVILNGERLEADGWQTGAILRVEDAHVLEARPNRNTVTLAWEKFPGSALRIRFQNVRAERFPEGQQVGVIYGRIVATRAQILENEVRKAFPELDLEGEKISIAGKQLVNPLRSLDNLLQTRIRGTRSVIHGDLNLENILVGPGGLIWLIDFAGTREGHTLFDFARLEVEITTQVIAEHFAKNGLGVEAFLECLGQLEGEMISHERPVVEAATMLGSVRRIAHRCLYDPADRSEFHRALVLAYIGSLKFANLDELGTAPLPKMLAFTAAAALLS